MIRRLLDISDSNMISAVGYDPAALLLLVEFDNGAKYVYSPVTHKVFCELINAESIGAYFSKQIKAQTQCTKLDAESERWLGSRSVSARPEQKAGAMCRNQLPAREQLPLLDVLEPPDTKGRKKK